MTVIAHNELLPVTDCSWTESRNDIQFKSVFGSQSLEVLGPLWLVDIAIPPSTELASGGWRSEIMKLKGGVNQLSMHNLNRPVPLGTMRGSMTFNNAVVKGETVLPILAAGEADKTLLAGDCIGFGSGLTQQVVMIVDPAVSDGSGNISVTVAPALRNAFAGGDPITYLKPKILFRLIDSKVTWAKSGRNYSANRFQFLEDIRP